MTPEETRRVLLLEAALYASHQKQYVALDQTHGWICVCPFCKEYRKRNGLG